MSKMKTFSTVAVLAISGIMTMLIFTGSDSSQTTTSNMAGIPNVFNDIRFDSNWLEEANLNGSKLDSCVLADVIIGKNGISKCDS